MGEERKNNKTTKKRISIMELNVYQKKAMETCMPESRNDAYMLHGLNEEVGELNGKISKAIRKGLLHYNHHNMLVPTSGNEGKLGELEDAIKKEAGDILWMLAGFCSVRGWVFDEIGGGNLDKLAARKEAGTIVGNGDGTTKEERL